MPPDSDPLESLLTEAQEAPASAPRELPSGAVGGTPYRPEFPAQYWPSGVSKGVQKVHYTHDAMINLIISDPCISQNELAAHFGYTAGWVSQIIASDAFQARLAERSSELVDPTIRSSIEDRFKGIVLRSL